jgi:hypothetical protein
VNLTSGKEISPQGHKELKENSNRMDRIDRKKNQKSTF